MASAAKRETSPDGKYRLPVKLAWAGNAPVEGELTLSRHSEYRAGPQTILERLNERVRVLPVVHGNVAHLVNRELIDWVAPGNDVDPVLIGPSQFVVTHEEHVRVNMAYGGTFEGVLTLEMPEGFNRVSDFLNGDDDFFTLKAGSRTVLVNKRRIREMLIQGSTPPPPSKRKAA